MKNASKRCVRELSPPIFIGGYKRLSVSLFHLYILDEIFDRALDDVFFFNESTVARSGLFRDASG